MAKFLNTLGDISGKVGNAVFTRNRYGGVLRRRAVPVNVRSQLQRTSRANFSNASAYWRQIIAPAGGDLAWNAFAANFPLHQGRGTKQAVTVTGQAFSVAINALRNMLGLTSVATPPDTWGTDQPTYVSAAVVGSTSIIVSAIGGVTPDATHLMIIRATGPLSAGVRFIGKSKYKVIQVFASPAFPVDITANYIGAYGAVPKKGAMVGIAASLVKIKTGVAPGVADTACPGQPVFKRAIAS